MHQTTKIILTMAAMLCAGLGLYGQVFDFDHYQRLRCQGELPSVLLQSAKEKYESQRKELGIVEDAEVQKQKEEFVLSSAFAIDGFMKSGSILFNDPVTEYLNLIKGYLLREQPELNEKINVFTIRSSYVNAFATHEGAIFVTTGLVSHAPTEASLAFVLAHEIQHYLKQHGLNRHVNTAGVRGKNMSETEAEKASLAVSMYSKTQEMEADSGGLNLYLSTAYSSDALKGAFDLLAYANQPFDPRVPFDVRFLATQNMTFTTAFLLDTVAALEVEEDFDDEGHTHPNVKTRRLACERQLAKVGEREGVAYIFGQDQFNAVRDACRFEVTWSNVAGSDYEIGIYHAYQLLQKYPNSIFLKQLVAVSLLRLVSAVEDRAFVRTHTEYSDVQGEFQRLLFWIETVDPMGLNLAAVHWVREAKVAHPDVSAFADIESALLQLLIHGWKTEVTQYATEDAFDPESFTKSIYRDTLGQSQRDSVVGEHIDNLYLNKAERYADSNLKIHETIEQTNRGAVLKLFESTNLDSLVAETDKGSDAESNSENFWMQNHQSENVNAMVLLNPDFKYYDREGKNSPYNPLRSFELTQDLKTIIQDETGKLGLDAHIYDMDKLQQGDADKLATMYNVRSLLALQLYENLEGMPGFEKAEREKITQQLGSDYVTLLRYEAIPNRMSREAKFLLVFLVVFAPFFLPLSLLILITRSRTKVMQYCLVYNLKTAKVVAIRNGNIPGKVRLPKVRKQVTSLFKTLSGK